MEKLSDVARRLNAPLHGSDGAFTSVNTDTRKLQRGDLFVALKGEHFDAHEFVRRAGSLDAVGAVVSTRIECELPQIVVADTLVALQNYASSWRSDFKLPVVAVTGSNGKTTTKQMLSAIFAARGPALATEGNLNNHIGVPLTLLRLRAEHRTAVIEMGANHPGEIAALTAIARPDAGVITQAGDAHLEGFGTREGVARAKGELFAGMRSDGLAAINRDDIYYPLWRELAGTRNVISFGLHEQADVRALNVVNEPTDSPTAIRFEVRAPVGRVPVRIPLPGRHNVSNALAAATVAVGLGMDLESVAQGLAHVQGASGRVSWKTTREGARVLDDTYNANPTSMAAALDLLAGISGERIAILGDMGELGVDAARLHFEVGKKARSVGINKLLVVGKLAREMVTGFGEGARHFDSVEELGAAARSQLKSGVSVLVKGSRSSRMERVVAALLGEESVEASH